MVRWSDDEWEERSHNFTRHVNEDSESKTENLDSMPALKEHSSSGDEDELEYVLESEEEKDNELTFFRVWN